MSKFNMSIPCIQVSCLNENYSNFYPKFYGPDKSALLNFCHDVVKLCAGVVFALRCILWYQRCHALYNHGVIPDFWLFFKRR